MNIGSTLMLSKAFPVASAEAFFALSDILDVEALHSLALSGLALYLAIFKLAALSTILTYSTFTYHMSFQNVSHGVDCHLALLQVNQLLKCEEVLS